MIFGLILIAAQLIWKSIFIGNYFFWQDDFHFTELALGHSFTWSYLTYVGAGHLFPGVYAIVWVVSRVALYNWGVRVGDHRDHAGRGGPRRAAAAADAVR